MKEEKKKESAGRSTHDVGPRSGPDNAGQAALTRPQLLQRTVGNRALTGGGRASAGLLDSSRSAIIQRTLGKGVGDGTEVVKHGPDADKEGFKTLSWDHQGYMIEETATKQLLGPVKTIDKGWGTKTEQANSRKEYLSWLNTGAGVKASYVTMKNSPGYPRDSFGYWFYYMLQQIDDQDEKIKYLKQVYEPRPDYVFKKLDDNEKLAILTEMFKKGFVTFAALEQEMTNDPTNPVQLVKSGGELLGKSAISGSDFGFGFRGDSRQPGTLRGHGGFGAKVDSKDDKFRKSNGLDQEWNPFKYPDKLPGWQSGGYNGFFRRSDKDNDLNTVVSVAPNWFDATKFPMLEEKHVPIEEVTYKGKKAKRTVSWVYMMIVEKGFDTKKAQGSNAFPEIATYSIPWTNHLAWFKIERIHHGETANDGHLINVLAAGLTTEARERHQKEKYWGAMVKEVLNYKSTKDVDYNAAGATA